MTGIEVQWIGSSCGRHGSYTFYRGFRLIQDGKVANYCLGEFYFVKNSSTQPICIAELQLVWHDASTDSKLASARLYFKPEDTQTGRLSHHGEDELLYADQKVVIKCHDMASWVCPGKEWSTGLLLPCETDFAQLNGSPKLSLVWSNPDNKPKEKAQATGASHLHILTFPAYCRYRALSKRLSEGGCFTMKQILSLGGLVASNKTTKMVFCRESFHNPDLDKFELSIENKAPILKGRPRKKKRLKIENSTNRILKNRFLAELNDNCQDSEAQSPKSRVSDDDVATDSDVSEDSGQYSDICQPKRIVGVTEKTNVTITAANRPSLNKPQVSQPLGMSQGAKPASKLQVSHPGPPPLQPSNQPQIPRLIPVSHVRLSSAAEPAAKAIMKIESKPPPLVGSEIQSKGTETLVTAAPKVISKPQSVSSVWTPPYSVIPVTVRASLPVSTTVTMATANKVSVTGTSHLPVQKSHNDHVSIKVEPGQDGLKGEGKGSKQLRVRRMHEDHRTPKGEEQGKENVQEPVEKKTRKRLREPGDLSDIENCEDEDEKYFMQSLRDFMKSRNTPIGKIPALGFKKVNLWTMYNCTQKLGGYEMVTSKRLWRYVYDSLGGCTTITSAATYTRRHYEKLLLPYERHVRGQLSAMSKEKDIPPEHKPNTQPSPQVPVFNSLPLKKEVKEVVIPSEPTREPGKAVKRHFQPLSQHSPQVETRPQSAKQQQQVKQQPLAQPQQRPMPVTQHVPRITTENALPVSVNESKGLMAENTSKVEQCVGTSGHLLVTPSNMMVDGTAKRDVIDLTEAEENETPVREPARVPHHPAVHSHLPQVQASVCSHPPREQPQAERLRGRGATSPLLQSAAQTRRNTRKLSAGELTAVADAHYKTQLTARQQISYRQDGNEVNPAHTLQTASSQHHSIVKSEKECKEIQHQRTSLPEDEAISKEKLVGVKRKRSEELDADRISRLSPAQHVKQRRTVSQPSQVSVDDHFEQWRRKTQEVQIISQAHTASQGTTTSQNTLGETTAVQERTVASQYGHGQPVSDRRPSATDGRLQSETITVTDTHTQHTLCSIKENQHLFNHSRVKQSHESHTHGQSIHHAANESRKNKQQGQDSKTSLQHSHNLVIEDGISHLHGQRLTRPDISSHIPHSHSHVVQNSFHHHVPSSHAQNLQTQSKDERHTPEYYPVRVNPDDVSSKPPNMEMEMGDVFPTASSYVGAHFYPAHWTPSGEFLEYPPQSGYQLVAAGDKVAQCSSSRIFMPPSIFAPMGMPPLSPSMLTPAHLVTSPDGAEVHIHPHCLLGSYPCTHQMPPSATANFPLLQG